MTSISQLAAQWIKLAETSALQTKLAECAGDAPGNSDRDRETRATLASAIRLELAARVPVLTVAAHGH